jgi:LDH2 family malate/lactate/ureidoglycolate dehydrogenase
MDASSIEPKHIKVTSTAAQAFVEGVLVGNGTEKENAAFVAKCLIQADLRGVDTHGMNRIPSYMASVRNGVLDPKATPSLNKITPVVAQVS